jgi:PAS domain-containing protein
MVTESKSENQRDVHWSAKKAKSSTAYLARMVDYAPEALIATDNHHKVLGWNNAAERIYGWSAESVANFLVNLLCGLTL